MSLRFVLGRENVPCVVEVVNRSLKADCTDFNTYYFLDRFEMAALFLRQQQSSNSKFRYLAVLPQQTLCSERIFQI